MSESKLLFINTLQRFLYTGLKQWNSLEFQSFTVRLHHPWCSRYPFEVLTFLPVGRARDFRRCQSKNPHLCRKERGKDGAPARCCAPWEGSGHRPGTIGTIRLEFRLLAQGHSDLPYDGGNSKPPRCCSKSSVGLCPIFLAQYKGVAPAPSITLMPAPLSSSSWATSVCPL